MEYVPAKKIVMRTKSGEWFGADYNMNIYRGCSHGCVYCDSRSDCYGISNFESVKAKKGALEIIKNDLRGKVKKGVISTGAMSDPYNPQEKTLELTRKALTLIDAYEFGIDIATKGTLITRDIDVLSDINEHSPVLAKITVTADDKTARILEPCAPSTSDRLAAVNALYEGGIFAGILLMPVLPFITDTHSNIKQIVKLAYENRAKFIYAMFGVTLRDRQREYFFEKLDIHYSGIKEKYISAYKNSYSCVSPNANSLWDTFATECEKYGILYSMKAITTAYKYARPKKQLTLF